MKVQKCINNVRWKKTICELKERSFEAVTFEMEDLSFVYFLGRATIHQVEIKICFESNNIYQRKIGYEDWQYVDNIEDPL